MSSENPQVPPPPALGCDFHEPYFGASYPDGCCIDGYLWDLDSCDSPGGPLSSGGDDPCPVCNHGAWLERGEEEFFMQGYESAEKGEPFAYKHKKIRWEQPGDAAKIEQWWLAGYREQKKEVADKLHAARSQTPPQK